jgi:hypothetical protein
MNLTFNSTRHEYRVNGVIVPSVTQVLSLVTDATWFTDDCRWRGSAVHAACQYLDEGDLDWATVEPEHEGYVRAWERAVRECGFVWDGIEEELYHPQHQYAGRRDRRGRIGQSRVVVDLKTSATLAPQTAMQLAAYVAPLESPRAYRRFAVRLKPDGTYTVKEYPVAEYGRDWNNFLVLLAAWRLRREYIKQ